MNKSMLKKVKSILFSLFFITFIIYLINKTIDYLAVMRDRLNSNSGRYYDWKFGKIYYKKQGTGTPLLLIHDLSIYSCAYEWNKIIKNLSENHTVYTLDLLGCGRSDKPAITYTSYLYVQLISDFVKNIIGTESDIIASNNSSPIAIMALQDNQDLFRRIILINPPKLQKPSQLSLAKAKAFMLILSLPVFGTFIYNIITSKSFLKTEFKQHYFYNTRNYSNKIIDTYYEAAHLGEKSSKFLYASIIGNYTYSNIRNAMEKINKKIIIIKTNRLSNSDSIIKNYCSINPYIEFEIIENAKMLPHFEIPNTFIETLNKYI